MSSAPIDSRVEKRGPEQKLGADRLGVIIEAVNKTDYAIRNLAMKNQVNMASKRPEENYRLVPNVIAPSNVIQFPTSRAKEATPSDTEKDDPETNLSRKLENVYRIHDQAGQTVREQRDAA